MSWMVSGASAAWSTATAVARGLVDAGLLQGEKLDSRVVGVGNLQAGGAGKTPLVARIASEALERGQRVCVLSRGYGGAWEREGGVIRPGSPTADPRLAGDEPALLQELLPRVFIGVGADRVESYRRLARDGKFDLVLLDDGFQHWRIERDVDVLAVTSAGRGEAIFRDWPSAVARADLVVWTKGEKDPPIPRRPDVKVRYRLPEGEPREAVWLVTGVADTSAAAGTVREAGHEIARHLPFPDHARYSRALVDGILEEAGKAGCAVAVTGKDWVKWRTLGIEPGRVRVLEPELVFEWGREAWDRVLWGR